ncbi:chromosome partitioning protein [Streptomyces sp. V4I23]|uniref:ParA family protein n=1 Tax=Streptomyces sp. V4I23 TaxID=3042282 RepID=UPI002784EB68|nr:ParA family protein [Streptomyces sp. V4I23]MDQ1005978.1 chromosome partitioning protein [Streptomyces sp. V4I23]
MAVVVGIVSQKGGPGKTTTTVNLASSLALNGLKVLVVDLDPQAQAGVALGVVPQPQRSAGFALYAHLNGMTPNLADMIYSRDELLQEFDDVGRLDLFATVQSTMVDAERKVAGEGFEGTLVLQHVLRPIRDHYDFILIDTPPSVSALSAVALAAANFVAAVCEPLYATVPGVVVVKGLTEATSERTHGRATPQFLGTIINKANPPSKRTTEDTKVESRLDELGLGRFQTQVRRNGLISAAFDEGRPVCIHSPNHEPSGTYSELAVEIIDRIKQRVVAS